MAHKSRLGVIVIDCQAENLQEACDYWSAALGVSAEIDSDGKYAVIDGYRGQPRMLLQAVDHAPRVHLDFETDDREAEAARLEALGAKIVARIKSWIVMETPTGHRVCLVGPQGDDFPGAAREWP